ncbi:heterokaryon incompatibility protein-domain-containing protein [Staphylotrichum tortipilum]|uniref:Heterokaryon incompatibility protein-domain-containing protein n=1 Tax=Staphylotrichum tortipilum TaxID=2831512 RepID=A0AAN6MDK1_9PEZI|nr:heterokaryon incompatibility protein-domain-containing protein [Staphylotrichum longicolle]
MRPPPYDLGSDESLNTAKGWLDVCSKRHACFPRIPQPLPSRLLEFSLVPNQTQLSARLYQTAESAQPTGNYAALSYCWGQSTSLKTTTSNIDEHVNGIEWAKLPLLVQDVAKVVMHLGLNYLWVDALCIIQDSQQDKEKEIAKMAGVYSNAFVTISAATGAERPLLERRANESVTGRPPIEVPFLCSDLRPGSAYLYQEVGSSDPTIYSRKDLIHQRAWTLQEHVLSPRLLVFSHWQLLWHCSSCGEQDGYSISGRKYFRLLGLGSLDEIFDEGGWHTIVQNYSRRKLSFPSDRLLAISAISEKVHASRSGQLGQYLAGMWSETITWDLLWSSDEAKGSRIGDRGFPSWSWVSVNGPVTPMGSLSFSSSARFQPMAELTGYQVDLALDFAPFGNLKTSELTIRGSLAHRSCDLSRLTFSDQLAEQSGDKYIPRMGTLDFDTLEDLQAARQQAGGNGEVDMWCLTIACFNPILPSASGGAMERLYSTMGLILIHVRDNVYSRIGRFSTLPCIAEEGLEDFRTIGVQEVVLI